MKKLSILLLVFAALLNSLVEAQITPPALLNAEHQINDSNVYLSWWEPGTPASLHYDNGTFQSSIGLNEEAIFDVAIRFNPDQLAPFDGMMMTNFSFVPAEATATYVLKVWTGENADSTIYTDTLSNLSIAQWNTVPFNIELLIDASKTYYFGYRINTPTGYPAGCDFGPGTPGKSDLIRFDSAFVSLISLNEDLDINWNIMVELESTTDEVVQVIAQEEVVNYLGDIQNIDNQRAKEPKTLVQESKGPTPDSYIIYRDNVEIGTVTEGTYHDVLPESGEYEYEVSALYGLEESSRTNKVVVLYDNNRIPVNCVVSMGFLNAADFSPNNGVSVFKGLVEIDYEMKEAAPVIFHSAAAILGQDPFATDQTEELFMHYFLRTFGFPAAYFNCVTFQGGGSGSDSMFDVYRPLYEEAKNTLTPLAFESRLDKTGTGTYNLNVKATKVGVFNSSDLQLVTVLTEERIEHTWASEELDEVRFVARQIFPDTYGTQVHFIGDSVAELDVEIEVDQFEPASNYRVVTYIQDTNSLYIFNGDYLTLPESKRVVFEIASEGMAVEGASISVNDDILLTDENGIALTSIMNNMGTIEYEVYNDGYEQSSGSFDIANVDTVKVELSALVGIATNIKTKSLVYPNPSTNIVNINSTRAVQVNVFDLSGKMVRSITHASNQHQINMENIEVGIYYIQLFDGNSVETIKLIKE